MRIASIGGGPAGLYFALLMKQAFPDSEIVVHERNRADDTFGWGVVFSSETLEQFEQADAASYAEIVRSFARWDDIETRYRGTSVTSTGHGFSGLSRRRLLQILQGRCRELGVELRFESEVGSVADVASRADLVLAADGVNSRVRTELEERFRPSIEWGRCKFTWLGTTLPLRAFTFLFEESEHGLFQVHAYPFEAGTSTFIVECHEDVWRRAGLEDATEQDTVAYCENLFREHLGGHRLLTNRSLWRTFPTVRNERWHHDNVVLLGDAAHTAHFSIGSGTKLAMEDSIALVAAFRAHGTADVPRVLAAYQESRFVEVAKLQKAAETSREWFENSSRWLGQHPLQFTFNLLTRSKRITFDNLRRRDPALVERVVGWFAEDCGAGRDSAGRAPVPMFTPFRLRGLELPNRVVVSPMCMYTAEDGLPGDFHLVHLGSRAQGGAGLVMTEMTDVAADARITPGCAGLWSDAHAAAWRRIVEFVHRHTPAKIGVQLAHAGRKGSACHPWEGFDRPLATEEGAWETVAPSPLPFAPGWPAPREMSRADMDRVREDFVRGAELAEAAGFDLVELHMAHGYLLSTFISPLTNVRTDDYGGPLGNRLRFPLEVLRAVRAAWPERRPLAVRISATDWVQGAGLTGDDAVEVARQLAEHGADLIDVSTSGNVIDSRPNYGRMYQVPFADRIRHEVGVPVMAVGAILGPDHVNTVLAAGRADLCALARPHLRDPYLTLRAARRYGFADAPWPPQYLLGRDAPDEPPG